MDLPFLISHPITSLLSRIHKKENRLLWKSVSLLAHYCPSDHLQAIAHRPILNVLEYQELIRKPPEKVNKYKLPNHLILRTTHLNQLGLVNSYVGT